MNKQRVIEFVISGAVPSKKNLYKQGRGHWYKPSDVVDYIDDAILQIKKKVRKNYRGYNLPFEGDVEVNCIFDIAGRDKDGDNLQTTLWDILQAAKVIKNDSQIVSWFGHKSRKQEKDLVRIQVKELYENTKTN